ncbi:transmembrane 4 L6 family member 4 [Elgaria multicarinata webbii]|uniref:transmembrane 4 L6 family member 4 n=1 Tax=Elgaria multicarinata webbii TaxID=159646 RepID=UPI002FCD4D60
MCCGKCAKCLGTILIPLAVLCTIANILLFFPGGTIQDSANISDEVWYFGGILGSGLLMLFPALVFLGLNNNDCCGCCGNESCGKRFAMFSSIIFAAVGILGAAYNIVVASLGVHKGPKCLTYEENNTWSYPFNHGDYLDDKTLWELCKGPESIVTWNLTLFSLLMIMGCAQAVLCLFQVINGLFGAICGDHKCCEGNGAV